MSDFSPEQKKSFQTIAERFPNAEVRRPVWVSIPHKMTQLLIAFRTTSGRIERVIFDEDELDDEHMTGEIAEQICQLNPRR